MRVLIAPDAFTGTLTAPQAAAAMAAGWRAQRPDDELDLCPLSDGGPGFVHVLAAATGGRLLQVATTGPLGAPLSVPLLLVPEGGGTTAWVESALACGSALVPAAARDPLAASTRGVGTLMEAARAAGATRVVVGLGGSGTTDAGAGMLAALGAGPAAVLARGGGGLGAVTAADLSGLPGARARWAGTDLVAASDVDVPLLGEHGAARGFGPQKGAGPEQVDVLERALARFAAAARAALGDAHPDHDPAATPGAGAAGGLGLGLALLGARRSGGALAVTGAVGLHARALAVAASGGLVLTGEGSLDWQSLRGKVVAQVVATARSAGAPVHAVAGQVRLDPAQVRGAGLAGAHAVAGTPEQVERAMADPAATLAERVRVLAASWPTPSRRT